MTIGTVRMADKLRVRLAAVVIAVCGMLWVGPYTWPASDHAQDLLPILARLDASLFGRDFAVQSFLGPTPRLVYQWLIASLMQAGLPAAWAYFVCQIATLASASVMGFFISRWLARRFDTVVVVSSMLWLALLFPAASHYKWNHPIVDARSALAGTLAMGFAVWGWYHGLRRRWGFAYTLFGLAALLQVLVGLMAGLLMLPVLLADMRCARSRRLMWVGGICVWVACGIAIAVPTLVGGVALDAGELVRIFGRVRAPHHWLPSDAGRGYWINQVFLAIGAVLLGKTLEATAITRRIRFVAIAVFLTTAVCLLANYVFVELFPVALIAKLQFQRTLTFAHLGVLLLCTAAWQQMVRGERIGEGVMLMVIPIARLDGVALALFAGGLYLRHRSRSRLSSGLIVAGGLLGVATFPSPSRYPLPPLLLLGLVIGLAVIGLRNPRAVRHINGWIIATAVILAATTTAALQLSGRITSSRFAALSRVMPAVENYETVPASARELATFLQRSVPRDALILLPPQGEVQFVPLLAQRSAVFSWKNIPYTDQGIAEWDRRLSRSVGRTLNSMPTDEELQAGWGSIPAADLVEFARSVGAEFIVSRDEWHRLTSGSVVGRAGGWTVWKIR